MRQVIFKRRTLPAPGVMRVRVGDAVQHDTIVAELDYVPGAMYRLEAAKSLGISSEHLGEKMLRRINERVSKGDVLARSTEFYCVKEVISPLDGYVALWSKHQGYLYLRSMAQQAEEDKPITFRASETLMGLAEFIADFIPAAQVLSDSGRSSVKDTQIIVMAGQRLFKSRDVVAPFTCRVSVFSEEEGVIMLTPLYRINQLAAHLQGVVKELPEPGTCLIASFGHRFAGTVGYGDERSGRLRVLPSLINAERDLTEDDIGDDLADCIVVAGRSATLAALRRLALAQISGLVLGSLDIDTLAEFSGQDPLRQLGQLMALPYPIVLLQGFEGAMPEETYREISSLAGCYAVIDASTQLRAGVARPELLVPLAEEIAARGEDLLSQQHTVSFKEQLQEGDRVLLLREPCAGKQATLLSIGSRLQETAAGTRAVLAEVCLECSSETLFVPLANCLRVTEEGCE